MRAIAVILVASSALFSTGCPADDLACAEVDPSCAPLYQPTFENVYDNTIATSCAVEGGACHAADGNAGGMTLDTIDNAYQALTGGTDPRVVPFDAECSLMSKRINASSNKQVMPPGDPMSDAERCAIEQWIANGAQR